MLISINKNCMIFLLLAEFHDGCKQASKLLIGCSCLPESQFHPGEIIWIYNHYPLVL